jgi:pSer/pThr/pTyr-binding forkhead associated (FHA) protein
MAYVFCNQCGRRNPPTSKFCSSCGSVLDMPDDHTITIAKTDEGLDAPGSDDDVIVNLDELVQGAGNLIVRSGSQAGATFALTAPVVRLGRSDEYEISLDDITVSRLHAEVRRSLLGYDVTDKGSLNGTYVNQQRIDGTVPLRHGDELQIGKFRLVFFERGE